jgi:hypothetical protein
MNRERRRLLKIKNWLVDNFPPPTPVRVIVGVMPKDYKDCVGTYQPPCDSVYATIRICIDQSRTEKVSTLIHEWAHLRIDPDAEAATKTHGGHTNEFYLEYGRMERAFFIALDHELKTK